MLDSVLQDLRHGLRLARSSPALVLTAASSLALGIGATVSMFAIVNAVLLRPVPVDSPEELVFLYTGTEESPYGTISYPDFLDYQEGSTRLPSAEVHRSAPDGRVAPGAPRHRERGEPPPGARGRPKARDRSSRPSWQR